jgi:hypothetical protein
MTNKLVVVRDPDSGLGAFYVNGELAWDFGPNDPFAGSLGLSTGLEDALEEIAALLGFEYEYESRHPVSFKSWTDYGWEWDAEWPQKLEDAPEAEVVFYDGAGLEVVAPKPEYDLAVARYPDIEPDRAWMRYIIDEEKRA